VRADFAQNVSRETSLRSASVRASGTPESPEAPEPLHPPRPGRPAKPPPRPRPPPRDAARAGQRTRPPPRYNPPMTSGRPSFRLDPLPSRGKPPRDPGSVWLCFDTQAFLKGKTMCKKRHIYEPIQQSNYPSDGIGIAVVDLESDEYLAPFEPIAGWGACKSCDCAGYVRKKPDICRCGHHFSQHRD